MSHPRPGPAATSTSTPSEPHVLDTIELATRPNPFAAPLTSAGLATRRSTVASRFTAPAPTYFHSRRIKKGEVERPWLNKKDPRDKWITIIPICGLLLGMMLSGLLIYDGLQTVSKHTYCPVLLESFGSRNLDPEVWTKEVEVGGFGYASHILLLDGGTQNFLVMASLTRPLLQMRTPSSGTACS